jgi:hypothetical protein
MRSTLSDHFLNQSIMLQSSASLHNSHNLINVSKHVFLSPFLRGGKKEKENIISFCLRSHWLVLFVQT